MKIENIKWYIGWIFFPAWYLIGKKYIILPVIQSVFEAMSYSDAYLITNYLWNLIAIVILFSLYGTGILRDIKQINSFGIYQIICCNSIVYNIRWYYAVYFVIRK